MRNYPKRIKQLRPDIITFALPKRALLLKVPCFFRPYVPNADNLLYYWNFGFDFKAGASLLISFSIPATIWTYSDLIFEDIKKNAKAPIKKKLTKKSTTKFKNVIAA